MLIAVIIAVLLCAFSAFLSWCLAAVSSDIARHEEREECENDS